MPDMHTAIPCTGSTADQAVSTIHVQLGTAKHLTRPLTILVCTIICMLMQWSVYLCWCNKRLSIILLLVPAVLWLRLWVTTKGKNKNAMEERGWLQST